MEPISPELVLVDPELAIAVRDGSRVAPFRVAFVCTGNRFRSALAEAAFRTATTGLPLEVSSYGVLDLGSAPPLPQAIQAATAHGLEISAHVARPLVTADLSEVSLAVGFEAHHAAAAVEIAGAPVERVFLLLELVELLDRVHVGFAADPIERAVTALACAHRFRHTDPASAIPREIPDPADVLEAGQATIGRIVYKGTTQLARELFGPVLSAATVFERR